MKVLAQLIAIALPEAKPDQITPVLNMASLYLQAGITLTKGTITHCQHRP